MDYAERCDSELMTAFYDCDQAAVEEIDPRYRTRLCRFFPRLGWIQDQEDLTQETFVRVYVTKETEKGRYRAPRPFKPWLYAVARNVAIDAARRRGRRPETVPIAEASVPGGGGLDQAAQQELGDVLRRCLTKLSEQERTFIVLWDRGWGELTQTEIADVLRVSSARVTAIKKSALSKLRQCKELQAWL